MSTATNHSPTTIGPLPLEVPGPVTRVPSLDELAELTSVPDQRVVFRGVEWPFYEQLVDSIPEASNIHVDYDGKDLEIMGNGPDRGDAGRLFGPFVAVVVEELSIPCKGLAATTWKRPKIHRGLESDQCFLAIEVDISPPQVDRAGIYAALKIPEVWKFDGRSVVIERLTAAGTYQIEDASAFLPVTAEEIRRWVVDEDARSELAWEERLRAEMKKKRSGNAAPGDAGKDVLSPTTEPMPDA
jgi:hypothetical protein